MHKIKKTIPSLCLTLATVMTFSSLATSAASAAERTDYEKRDVPTYFFSMEKSGTTECVFFEDEPSVPYINPVDYLKSIYTVGFEEVKNSDGTYTVTKATGEKMTLDANADTVAFDIYANYYGNDPNQEGSSMAADFVQGHPNRFQGEPNGITFELSKYQIDVAEVEGEIYLPLLASAARLCRRRAQARPGDPPAKPLRPCRLQESGGCRCFLPETEGKEGGPEGCRAGSRGWRGGDG